MRHAAENSLAEPVAGMRSHDDQIDVVDRSGLEDFGCGVTLAQHGADLGGRRY